MAGKVIEVLPGKFTTVDFGPYAGMTPAQVKKQAQYQGGSRTKPFVPTSKPADQLTTGDVLDQAAISTAAVPGIGDVVGFGADMYHLATNPSWGNAGFAALGALPFVPAGAALRAGKGSLRAADKPRIPDYEQARHPSPKAKARHVYSGAPQNSPILGGRSVKSRADEDELIEHYLARAEAGAEARYWYDDVSRRMDSDVGNLSGARQGAKDQQSAVFGHFSAGTAVPQNRLAQVRANNQYITGNPITAGTPARNADAFQTLEHSAVNPERKLKTGLFGMQVGGIPTGRGTHDFRDAINWGFPVKNSEEAAKMVGVAQHRWMDDMADRAVAEANRRKLGGFDDWTYERLQAAGWVAQKAEAKGVPVSALKDEVASTDNWLMSNIYHEAIPSKELVDQAKMSNLDERAYTIGYQQNFLNPEGQNALVQQTGMLSPEQVQFVGEWEDQLNPNMRTTVRADPGKGVDVMSEWSDEAVRFNSALMGLFGGQADVAYDFLRPAKQTRNINSYRVPFQGRSVTPHDLSSYTRATRKIMRERDIPGEVVFNGRPGNELEGTWIPPDKGKWKKIADDAEKALETPPKDRTPAQKAAVKAHDKNMKEVRGAFEKVSNNRGIPARNSGGLVSWSDSYKPSEWMKHLQNPKMRAQVKSMIPDIAKNVRATVSQLPLSDLGKKHYLKTLDLLEKGGLEAVEQAVKNGTLPAVMLAAILSAASQVPRRREQSQDPRQPTT